MTVSREDVRAKLLAYKSTGMKREKVDLPWMGPEFAVTTDVTGAVVEDNRLEIREMMGDESITFENMSRQNASKSLGFAVSHCLLMPGTTTPVFNELDADAIVGELGTSVLLPLLEQIQRLSGMIASNPALAPKDEAKNG